MRRNQMSCAFTPAATRCPSARSGWAICDGVRSERRVSVRPRFNSVCPWRAAIACNAMYTEWIPSLRAGCGSLLAFRIACAGGFAQRSLVNRLSPSLQRDWVTTASVLAGMRRCAEYRPHLSRLFPCILSMVGNRNRIISLPDKGSCL